MFAITVCDIKRLPYDAIVCSTDSNHKRGFGLVTYEYGDKLNVTVADAHDATKADLQIFNQKLLSLKGTPIRDSTNINKMPTVPNNLEQAMLSPEWPMWKLAIEDEIHGMFEQRHALDPVSIDNLLPEELRRVCKLTWVFTLKLKGGEVIGFKARLCAQCFSQIKGINFNRTHATSSSYSTFMCVLNLAVQQKLIMKHYDATKAYLNAY